MAQESRGHRLMGLVWIGKNLVGIDAEPSPCDDASGAIELFLRQNDLTAGFPLFVADESFNFLRLWPLFILILLLHYHQGEVTTRDITGGVLPWAGNDHRDPIIKQCAVLDVCL